MKAELRRLRCEQRSLDRKVMDFGVKLLSPFYEKRRETLKRIPKFWSYVIAETEPLRPFLTYDDSLIFDSLEDFWVEWDSEDSRNVILNFTFGDNTHFGPQTLSKKFIWKKFPSKEVTEFEEEGYYESDSVTPIEMKPGASFPKESFFGLFSYTKTDKDSDREENSLIVLTLVDEIYPAAMDLYEGEGQVIADEYDISESDMSETT